MAETRRPPPPPADVPKPARVAYYCEKVDRKGQRCGGFLLSSPQDIGRLDEVLCHKCHKRSTVYLGGRMTSGQVAEARLRESA